MEGIYWMGQDTCRFDGPPVVYLDPYRTGGKPVPAGLALVTHERPDQCLPADIARIRTAETVIVAPKGDAHDLDTQLSGSGIEVEILRRE